MAEVIDVLTLDDGRPDRGRHGVHRPGPVPPLRAAGPDRRLTAPIPFGPRARSQRAWNDEPEHGSLALASVASLMVSLDTLVVSTALDTIRQDLSASVEELEWTVNSYNLSLAVLLLPAAALGDRFGRRTLFAARPGAVHRGLGGLRAVTRHRLADRRTGRPGGGRRLRAVAKPGAGQLGLPRRAPRLGGRRAGGRLGHRGAGGPDAGRRGQPGPVVGVGVLAQRAHRRGRGAAGADADRRAEQPGERAPLDLPGLGLVAAGVAGPGLGAGPGQPGRDGPAPRCWAR